MITSLNRFADRLPKSYKTRATANTAFVDLLDGLDKGAKRLTGALLITERSDGRFALIVVNPDQDSFHFFLHDSGHRVGVFGVTP